MDLSAAPDGGALIGIVGGAWRRRLRATIVTRGSESADAKLDELGEPRYRAGQVWRWAARGAGGFADMSDLPLGLRQTLAETVPFSQPVGRARGARS